MASAFDSAMAYDSKRASRDDEFVNALNCAIMTIQGEGGGFSASERDNAVLRLRKEMERQISLPPAQQNNP